MRFTSNNEVILRHNMTTAGTLYIISAPSGGGKTSLVSHLLASVKNLEVSISHTTRPLRPGEVNGENYHFVDDPAFKDLIAKQAFLEHAKVFGNYYGTSKKWVTDKLRAGIDIILEIDWQGAQQIRALLPDTVCIFILPPSWQILQERLQEREQDNANVIAQRMAAARTEVEHYHEYDYLIVNDDFTKASADLQAILHARRLRQVVQQQKYANLLAKLLA